MSLHLCILGDANSPHTRRWAHEMLARGFRVSMVTARPEPLDGVAQHALRPVRRSVDWLLRAGEARRHVDALQPDLVHAHYVTSYGYLAARIGRHPLAMTAWGSDLLVTPRSSPLMHALTGWIVRRADWLTGDSEDLLDAIRAFRPRAPVELVHWGVDLRRFRPAAWAAKPGFRILSLRSWEPNYRIDVILQATRRLIDRVGADGIQLDLLGGGSQESALRALAAQLGLQQQVRFIGRVGDAAMAEAMAAARVSVSVPISDATSVSVLESMACGLPVIASDLPANRHWLAAADDALLIDGGDPQALADRLELLWRDDARAQRVGAAHAGRLAREGDRKVQMDRVAERYRELAAGMTARGRR